GQLNVTILPALGNQNVLQDEHEVVMNCNCDTDNKQFDKKLTYKRYVPITRYPLFRIKEKFRLWHSVNHNINIEPYSKKIPYLLTVHDVNFMSEEQGKRLDFRIKQFKSKLERSRALVYISEFAKKSTHEHFKVPDVPEYVIYNGNTFNSNFTAITDSTFTNYVPKRPFIFSIGKLVEKKNFHTLIEMLLFLTDIDLVIAGEMK